MPPGAAGKDTDVRELVASPVPGAPEEHPASAAKRIPAAPAGLPVIAPQRAGRVEPKPKPWVPRMRVMIAAGLAVVVGGVVATVVLLNQPAPAPRPRSGVRLAATLNQPDLLVVTLSPNGRLLADSTAGTFQLWNISNPDHAVALGQPANPAWMVHGPGPLAFSPDGSILAAGDDDGTVQLWDISDPASVTPIGQLLSSDLTGNLRGVASLAFSPDGHVLATGNSDGTIQLWNVAEPAHATALDRVLEGDTTGAHWNVIFDGFARGSRTLVSGTIGGEIGIWNAANPAHVTDLNHFFANTGSSKTMNSVALSRVACGQCRTPSTSRGGCRLLSACGLLAVFRKPLHRRCRSSTTEWPSGRRLVSVSSSASGAWLLRQMM